MIRKEVIFTEDGDYWVSNDPPGAHIYNNTKRFCIIVQLDEKEDESKEELEKRCIDKAISQLIRRYFNLRKYKE